MECLIMKINWMLCCCFFCVWLPVCFMLNSAEYYFALPLPAHIGWWQWFTYHHHRFGARKNPAHDMTGGILAQFKSGPYTLLQPTLNLFCAHLEGPPNWASLQNRFAVRWVGYKSLQHCLHQYRLKNNIALKCSISLSPRWGKTKILLKIINVFSYLKKTFDTIFMHTWQK